MALALPPLIIIHVLGTRAATVMFDIEPSYAWLMVLYWKWAPATGLRQTFVIVVAWIHGCMGVYYWMRLQSWWPTWRGYIYPFAFVVPVMALLGFVEGGKDALDLSGNREWMASVQAGVVGLDDPAVAKLYRIQSIFLATYTAVLILVLAARAVRLSRTRPAVREGTVEVAYVDGPTVIAPTGLSLLDVSRINEIAHTNICGGRGRCGTCRIRILDGAENLSGEMALERETLARIGAEAGTRLACQCVPNGSPIRIERLVPLDVDVDSALDSEKGRSLHPLEVSGASGAS